MRCTLFPVLAFVLLVAGAGARETVSVRQLRDVDLTAFQCHPNRVNRLIASEADLAKTLSELAPHCPAEVFAARAKALSAGLKRAGVNWSDHVLVIAQDWYGTGMAKPALVFSGPKSGVVSAAIQWTVPRGPVTPDTASCTFAFVVKRSAVKRIVVSGAHSGTTSFVVSPHREGQ